MKSRTTGSIIVLALAAIGTLSLVCFRSVAVESVYPVENAKRTFVTKVLSRVAGAFRGAEANAENVRLRREIAALAMLRGDLTRLEAENERLRKSLDYVARKPGAWIPAGVLSGGGGATEIGCTLRLDRGSLSGVRKGAVVAVPEGLVGCVTEVTPHTSKVALITDPSVKVACVVETGSPVSASGILSGEGGDRLIIRHLRNGGGLPLRSRVLTSGLGGVFPPGLEVGTLLDVRRDSRGLVREGEVLPPVDYSTLEDVFIRREG